MPEAGSKDGAALLDLVVEVAAVFFRMRAAGKRLGAVTPWSGGLWGLMRSLATGGPQTVPQLARARPVARQRIQRLANEMVEAGLAEFVDNPAHKRSKLLRLTAEGDAAYRAMSGRVVAFCDALAADMDRQDLRAATEVLRRLRLKLAEE